MIAGECRREAADMDPSLNLIFRCRVCGHEEEVPWWRVPSAADRGFVKELTLWCGECAHFGDGRQIFEDTGRRAVPGMEIIFPEWERLN